MHHREVSELLVKRVRKNQRALRRGQALLVEEMGVNRGRSRVDLALINSDIHGFEIKGAYDTLKRLPRQWSCYASVFSRFDLVVAGKHMAAANDFLPDWVGLIEIDDDAKRLIRVRYPRRNPDLNAVAVAGLLWREEALSLLAAEGLDRGIRTSTRARLYEELAAHIEVRRLQGMVAMCMRSRSNWRLPRSAKTCDRLTS